MKSPHASADRWVTRWGKKAAHRRPLIYQATSRQSARSMATAPRRSGRGMVQASVSLAALRMPPMTSATLLVASARRAMRSLRSTAPDAPDAPRYEIRDEIPAPDAQRYEIRDENQAAAGLRDEIRDEIPGGALISFLQLRVRPTPAH